MSRLFSQTTAAAITADRVRAHTILTSPEARRNPSLAADLALMQGMGAPAALRILAASPAQETPYEAAMKLHGMVPVPGVDAASAAGGRGAGPEERRAAREAEIKEGISVYNFSKGYAPTYRSASNG